MANRFVLNTISYHGSGAIKEIPGELQRRGYKKIFVCSDPDLVKFGVTAKVTDELDAAGIAWSLYSEIKPNPAMSPILTLLKQKTRENVNSVKAFQQMMKNIAAKGQPLCRIRLLSAALFPRLGRNLPASCWA